MNVNTTAPATFLEKLREVTAPSHQALENLEISRKIISPEVTKSDYAEYLMYMHDVVEDIEKNIFPVLAPYIPDINSRKRIHLIENDLQNMGVEYKTGIKPVTAEGFRNNTAFAFGAMYVVEGSTLGGRFIYKNINTILQYNENTGASYFAGYGNTTGSHWKQFLEAFTTYAADNTNAVSEMIAGATHTFNAIKKYLS